MSEVDSVGLADGMISGGMKATMLEVLCSAAEIAGARGVSTGSVDSGAKTKPVRELVGVISSRPLDDSVTGATTGVDNWRGLKSLGAAKVAPIPNVMYTSR